MLLNEIKNVSTTNVYSEINDAAMAIGSIKDLTRNVRDYALRLIDRGFTGMDEYDIKELLRNANSEGKFSIRIALKVLGRRDPSEP